MRDPKPGFKGVDAHSMALVNATPTLALFDVADACHPCEFKHLQDVRTVTVTNARGREVEDKVSLADALRMALHNRSLSVRKVVPSKGAAAAVAEAVRALWEEQDATM